MWRRAPEEAVRKRSPRLGLFRLRLALTQKKFCLEPFHRLPCVLDLRRRGEAMSDQLAPGLEILRAAEIDGVVLQRRPLDEEAIAAGLLDRALQLHPLAALGPLEERRGLADRGLELGLEPRLDVDLSDLEFHRP